MHRRFFSPAIFVSIIVSIFIICLFFIKTNVSLNDFEESEFIHETAKSCHSVFVRLTNSTEQRCYPLLVNFADGCCEEAQKKNCRTGLQHGIQQCLMYNKTILSSNPTFTNRNSDILQRKRGAGYWLWKPYILFHELYLAREGDIIVYSDAKVDFVADIFHLTKLTDDQDIIVFKLVGWKESTWTKRDAFILLHADKPIYTNTSAGLASYLLLKKSLQSMAFVTEWLAFAQDSRAITDDNNILGASNYPDFREHRHDQVILSILAKKWNLTIYPDPSQWGASEKAPYPTIFNHHRSSS